MNKYFKGLTSLFDAIAVTDARGKKCGLHPAVVKVTGRLKSLAGKKRKVIMVGNGGSASIASHIVTDFLKNCRIPAVAFNDAALLTCISNDLGYENVFKVPVRELSLKGDLLIAISSSGKSANIRNAVVQARSSGCFIVTLSGFSAQNPLRKAGDLNFYVPSCSYGDVEILHMAICHIFADTCTVPA